MKKECTGFHDQTGHETRKTQPSKYENILFLKQEPIFADPPFMRYLHFPSFDQTDLIGISVVNGLAALPHSLVKGIPDHITPHSVCPPPHTLV